VIHINEQVLRRLPIQKAVDLKRDEWVVIYQEAPRGGRRLSDVAEKVISTFK
jgi:hypothetical protein